MKQYCQSIVSVLEFAISYVIFIKSNAQYRLKVVKCIVTK